MAQTQDREVELVTGPYRSGKSLWLVHELVDYCLSAPVLNRPVILTVPSHRYKRLVEERISQYLGEKNAPGLFGLNILPFYDLCHFVLRTAGVSFRLLGDALRPAVLLKSIEKVLGAGNLTSLSSIASFAGTHAQMLELIDELERAGLSPSEVISTLNKQAASDSRYIELAKVYQAYWLELESLGVYDERKLAYKAREVITTLGDDVVDVGILAIDGFDRFNPLQLSVLSVLSKKCQRTIAVFDYLKGAADSEYAWKDKSMQGLREAFAPVREREMLRELSANLNVASSISRSLDRSMEMEEVVRSVKGKILAGVKPSEIFVVARGLDPYMHAIKAAFESAGIEYYLDQSASVSSLPLIKYVRRLLNLPVDDFSRLEVLRVLRSPFCNLEYLEIERDKVDIIEQLSAEKMVVKGRSDWLSLGSPYGDKIIHLIERMHRPETSSLLAFVAFVEDLLDDLLMLPNDDEFADPAMVWEEHQALAEVRRALADLVQEDELLSPHYGERKYTYLEFFDRLDHAFENSNFRRPSPGRNALTICGADLVPNRLIEHLYIVGLNEGEFPRRGERSGFLNRDEVRKWLSFGVDIENPRQHESFEVSLYNSLVERATVSLTLSAPVYELEGEELVPSFFITEGDEGKVRAITYNVPRKSNLTKPFSVEDYAQGLLWFNGFGRDESGRNSLDILTEKLPESGQNFLRKVAEPLALVYARTTGKNEVSGYLAEQVNLGLLSVPLPKYWSVTRLSDYGKCPFKFWVSHMLGIDALKEPEPGLDPKLRGEVYHKCLELFYIGLKEKGWTVYSEVGEANSDAAIEREAAIDAFFEECIGKALAWLEAERPFKATDFWEYEKKELYFRLRRFLVKEKLRAASDSNEFVPVAFEKAFGNDKKPDSAPPLVIKAVPRGKEEELTVEMRGQIDRIDKSAEGRLRVVDYKAGSTVISTKQAADGSNLQMPVYAMAVSQVIERDAQVAKGIFLSIASGEAIGTFDFAKQDHVEVVDTVKEHIVSFVDGIKSGHFQVMPVDEKVCSYCDHNTICRIRELAVASEEED